MGTDQDKVRAYYATFDEWERLETPEGSLEFTRSLRIIDEYLLSNSRVLDLGGGPGRYSIELARRGHRMVLADLSPALLEQARLRFAEAGVEHLVDSVDALSAEDLGKYPAQSFDAVLAFGPFYHLLSLDERSRAAREIARVLKPAGLAFVAFIPRISGIAGLIERAALRPGHVSPEALRLAAESGVFRNASREGFQEGYYPLVGETADLLASAGLDVLDCISLRSIAHRLERELIALEASVRREVETLIASMSRLPEVVATSGHALVVARRAPDEVG